MPEPARLLIVDDDEVFVRVLQTALHRRGYQTSTAHAIEPALALARSARPSQALVDLNLDGESGLRLIQPLLQCVPGMQIVVLTGYASIATAVDAIKLGAMHYLTKPADADQIMQAFEQHQGNPETGIADAPMSVRRLEWEHVQRVLAECDGNISEAARKLNMHRRTLQRKLRKYPVKR